MEEKGDLDARERDILQSLERISTTHSKYLGIVKIHDCFKGSCAIESILHSSMSRQESIHILRNIQKKGGFYHLGFSHMISDSDQLFRLATSTSWNTPNSKHHEALNMSSLICHQHSGSLLEEFNHLCQQIFTSFLSPQGTAFSYKGFRVSPLFQQWEELTHQLSILDLSSIPMSQRLSFYLNLYNMMIIHGLLRIPRSQSNSSQRKWFGGIKYVIGGLLYSLDDIENGLIRANSKGPYSLMKPFRADDPRMEFAMEKIDPRVHFALVRGTKSCPPLRFYTLENIDEQLNKNCRKFLLRDTKLYSSHRMLMEVSLIFHWYIVDFGSSNEGIIEFLLPYLDKQDCLRIYPSLASGDVSVCYHSFDWAMNTIE